MDDRRSCLECSYLLAGLDEPRCPECGRAFNANDPATFRVGTPIPNWARQFVGSWNRPLLLLSLVFIGSKIATFPYPAIQVADWHMNFLLFVLLPLFAAVAALRFTLAKFYGLRTASSGKGWLTFYAIMMIVLLVPVLTPYRWGFRFFWRADLEAVIQSNPSPLTAGQQTVTVGLWEGQLTYTNHGKPWFESTNNGWGQIRFIHKDIGVLIRKPSQRGTTTYQSPLDETWYLEISN